MCDADVRDLLRKAFNLGHQVGLADHLRRERETLAAPPPNVVPFERRRQPKPLEERDA